MAKTLITCDCSGSMALDHEALSGTTGLAVKPACSALCTHQIDRAAAALSEGDSIFCCTQERRVFDALAEEMASPPPPVLDLRDRAGWSADSHSKTPKMSALIAEALLPGAPVKTRDVVSEGLCLVLGPADIALGAAGQLADILAVTALVEEVAELPDTRGFDVIAGRLRHASGALGGFRLTIDALRQLEPGGRGARRFGPPRDGGHSDCDIILDLSGRPPLFAAHEKREGYLRADPAHPPAVAAAILEASQLIGTFEKPLYVRTEPLLCAHSRAEQIGCSRCLDLCPTGAIIPNGDHVEIDPMICAGCGACSAACPSGAVSFDAPPVAETFRRVQTLAQAFLGAGGTAPRLLVHDALGAEMIRLSARYGRGLAADVIPMEMAALGGFGHAEMLAALAAGFGDVSILPGPGTDRASLADQIALALAIAGPETVRLLDVGDPDAMEAALEAGTAPAPVATPVRPLGTRRQITRVAAKALNPDIDAPIKLPEGAPYGAVAVDTGKCTLCLSCVSLCPSGALGDNPDLPQLRFQEDACLQCGLCTRICPESALSLVPRLDLDDAALSQKILHEEEPFACVECRAPFGTKSAIDKITEKLAGHSMFADPDRLRLIQMCDDCRVVAQMHSNDNPFTSGERPRTRTTDDYLSKRRDH